MQQKQDRRTLNRLYTVAIIVSLVVLVTAVVNSQRRVAQRDEAYMARALESEAEANRRREVGRGLYAQLAEALEARPLSFVCWGDANALGGRGGSLPAMLKDLLDETFFSPLRRGFSLRAGLYDASGFEADVYNLGVRNEGFNEIMARTGARGIRVAEPLELPAGLSRVPISMKDSRENKLSFAEQPNAKFGLTTIAGVEGVMYIGGGNVDRGYGRIAFSRSAWGEAIAVPVGTEVETEGATKYRQCYPILFFSEYDTMPAEDFIGSLWEVISLYGEGGRYYAVLCVTQEDSAWDRALAEAFGPRYLRCEGSARELGAQEYRELASRVFDCLDAQGAFDATRAAVDATLAGLESLGGETDGDQPL